MATIPTPFHLRLAHLNDAPKTASMAMRAFAASSLHYPTLMTNLNPHAHLYPADNYTGTLHRHRLRILNPSATNLVACDDATGTIIGNASFLKYPPPRESWRNWVLRVVVQFWQGVYGRIWPDRSEDPAAVARFVEATDKVYIRYREERYRHRWDVDSLSVDPDWQRRGVGRGLMAWVMERARMEGVCVVLGASKQGAGLYRGLGFVKVDDGYVIEGEDGGGIMEWWPEGVKERWDEADEKHRG